MKTITTPIAASAARGHRDEAGDARRAGRGVVGQAGVDVVGRVEWLEAAVGVAQVRPGRRGALDEAGVVGGPPGRIGQHGPRCVHPGHAGGGLGPHDLARGAHAVRVVLAGQRDVGGGSRRPTPWAPRPARRSAQDPWTGHSGVASRPRSWSAPWTTWSRRRPVAVERRGGRGGGRRSRAARGHLEREAAVLGAVEQQHRRRHGGRLLAAEREHGDTVAAGGPRTLDEHPPRGLDLQRDAGDRRVRATPWSSTTLRTTFTARFARLPTVGASGVTSDWTRTPACSRTVRRRSRGWDSVRKKISGSQHRQRRGHVRPHPHPAAGQPLEHPGAVVAGPHLADLHGGADQAFDAHDRAGDRPVRTGHRPAEDGVAELGERGGGLAGDGLQHEPGAVDRGGGLLHGGARRRRGRRQGAPLRCGAGAAEDDDHEHHADRDHREADRMAHRREPDHGAQASGEPCTTPPTPSTVIASPGCRPPGRGTPARSGRAPASRRRW